MGLLERYSKPALFPVVETADGRLYRHFDSRKFGRGVLREIDNEGFGNIHVDFYTVEPESGETSVVSGAILAGEPKMIKKDKTARRIIATAVKMVAEDGVPSARS